MGPPLWWLFKGAAFAPFFLPAWTAGMPKTQDAVFGAPRLCAQSNKVEIQLPVFFQSSIYPNYWDSFQRPYNKTITLLKILHAKYESS